MGSKREDKSSWNVLDHGPIVRLADNLWRVEGSLPKMSLRRTMTVVSLSTGELVLHSPIALRSEAMAELEALGTIAFAILPNAGHRLDIAAYHARYPKLRFFVPTSGVAETREAVPGASVESIDAFPMDPAVRFETLDGVKDGAEAAMIVRSPDGATVVLCDTVHNMDRKHDPLGFIMTALMGNAGRPRVSRAVRLFYISDNAAFRAHLERLARLPELTRFIVAHEKLSEGLQARADLERAAASLNTTTSPSRSTRRGSSSHSRPQLRRCQRTTRAPCSCPLGSAGRST
jgi:hypothetical protein